MNQISSISEFLLQAGTQYQVFDMSRTIRQFDAQLFLDIEKGLIPHPNPRQQNAWFGILFRQAQQAQSPYIWFVKLPLDEKGNIVAAARDQFLSIIVEALANQMGQVDADKSLPQNPYSFVPTQQQMADFNSITRHQLLLPPSSHFTSAKTFLQSENLDAWQEIALQGLSDFVVFASEKELTNILVNKLDKLAEPVVSHLLASLEHQTLTQAQTDAIIEWTQKQSSDRLAAIGLRSLSGSDSNEQVVTLIQYQLAQNEVSLDMLVVIAGRHWHRLSDDKLLMEFLEATAAHPQSSHLFPALFADLVQIPTLRPLVHQALRNPKRSDSMSAAMGNLFSKGSD